jgi:protein disulfide-isomerase
MVHQITKEVIDPEFAKWAAGNVILVELDYPRRTPQA